MASISNQQIRENADSSFISLVRQPHQRLTRHHQYYQHQGADHSTIYPIILNNRSAVVSVDGIRGGDPFPDYDNLIPIVRLDRIVEDEADREDGSINKTHYDNAGTPGWSDATDVDKGRVTQKATDHLVSGESGSSNRCDNSLVSCGFHCARKDVCGNSSVSGNLSLCEHNDSKNNMGNVSFASRSGSVGDSSSSITRINQGKPSFVGSSDPPTYLENNSTANSSVFGRDQPGIVLSQAPNMPSCSLISDVLAKEFVYTYRYQSAELGLQQQDPCSTFTKADSENAPQTRRYIESNCTFVTDNTLSDTPESLSEKSDTRRKELKSITSSTSAFETDNFVAPAMTKHTRSFSTAAGGPKVEQTVPGPEMKLLFDLETCKETGYNQLMPLGKPPIIVITKSTPKKRPSTALARTQFTGPLEQANAAQHYGLTDSNGEEKTDEVKNCRDYHTLESQSSCLGNRHSNDQPRNEPVGSASLNQFSNLSSSNSYSDLENVDKITPETAVLYGTATNLVQHSSYTENLSGSYSEKDMTPVRQVKDGLKLSEEEPRVNLSCTAGASAASPAAPTATTTTNQNVQTMSTTVHNLRLQTAADFNLNSYPERHHAKSNHEEVVGPAEDDSAEDYALPCDVKKQSSILQPQTDLIEVSTNIVSKDNKEKPYHMPREPYSSLIETDSWCLSEPQYTEISEATEPAVTKPSPGRFMLHSDHTHYKAVRLCEPAERRIHISEIDDIYAVPIPKSQRKTDQYSTPFTKPLLQPKQLFADLDSPPKPVRSPICSPESTVFEDIDNACGTPVIRNRVQVTCQIKPSAATGRFYSDSSDYDYSNIPKFGRYDFFSLGRRPKRLRGAALRNSKEVSVSLEMLLKLRHQSSSEMPENSAADQTASVDDILRSCREFDQIHAFYRGRTSSDSTHNSYLSSLSFVEISNIKKHIHDTKESENKKLINVTTFKKNGIENKLNGRLKVNGDHVAAAHLNDNKSEAPSRTVNRNRIQSNTITPINLEHVLSLQSANISAQNGHIIERKIVPYGSQGSSHGQQKFAAKVESENIPQSTQLGLDPPLAGHSRAVTETDQAKNSSSVISEVKYVSRSEQAMHSFDYDILETVLSDPSTISPYEKLSGFPHSREIPSNTRDGGENYQTQQEDTEAFHSQHCFSFSHIREPLKVGFHEKSEVSFSEVNPATQEALQYQLQPNSLNSPSSEVQYQAVVISGLSQEHRSPQQMTPDIYDEALTTTESPDHRVYSSGVTGPTSAVSIWSASGGDFSPGTVSIRSDCTFSPGIVSTHSDGTFSPGIVSTHSGGTFSESSADELMSPTQAPSFFNAGLEILEALKWLRAAGFPQYAQMFEEGQFPVDMGVIERDHDFLDQDSLKSLFRRLEKLNKCADLSLDTLPVKKGTTDEDEEEDLCALSDRWEYKKSVGRWSRKGVSSTRQAATMGSDQTEFTGHSQSQDSLLHPNTDRQIDSNTLSDIPVNPLLDSLDKGSSFHLSSEKHPENATREKDLNDVFIPTSPGSVTSEKIRQSNHLFRKMDMLKTKRSRGSSKRRNIVDISGPIVEDSEHLRAKLEKLNCVDLAPSARTLRREPSAKGQASNIGSRAASAERTDNQRSFEISAGQSAGQSSPSGHIPVQSSSASHIWLKSQSSGQILVHSPHISLISEQSPPTNHMPVQLESSRRIPIQSPPSSHMPLHPQSSSHTQVLFAPTSHIYMHSPNRNHIPVQYPSFNHISMQSSSFNNAPEQSSVYSGSKTALSRDEPIPKESKPQALAENTTNDLEMNEVTPRAEDRPQPGRFPRVLDNGYFQGTSHAAGAGAKNGTAQHSDLFKIEELKSYSPARRHRNSVYDNIEPDDKREGHEQGRMIFPGIYQLENSESGNHCKDNNSESGNHCKDNNQELRTSSSQNRVGISESITQHLDAEDNQSCAEMRSLDVSVVSSSLGSSDQTYGSSAYYKSVSFKPPLSQISGESKSRDETPASHSESKSRMSPISDLMTSKSKGVVHSSSLDSYFQENNVNCHINGRDPSEAPSRTTTQKEYDDFDLILQQLYQNINELSDYVSRETDINNSLEFDGALDLDPENSFSGGEGSNTAESSSEDPELVATDVSRDSLDQISPVSRERRDSGVGHSFPRAPSERRQKKLRWNSFQNSHKPDINCRAMQINHLTVYQMVRLQKLCLLKLTAIMERCLPVSRSGWNWMMPRFMKKPKTADFIDRKVFGVPLTVMAQRTGQPLPQCVLHAMRYLRRTSPNAVGIFRKSGVKSKIQQLRDYLEAHPDTVNFEGVNAYSVADMLKTYFRDLPECLLTNKMSEIFRSIYMYVPPPQRLEAIQTAIVLLPDENREVLQSILLFLSDISSHEADHQMNANNLAVCFTPTVFQLGPQQTMTAQSPKRNQKTSIAVPDPKEMMEQKAAHECLLMMILECKKLFTVFPSLYQQLQVHAKPQIMPVPFLDIGSSPSDVRAFGQERIQIILKEAHDKNRGWLPAFTVGDVEVFIRKPIDDCLLKEWKLIVEIEAPPIEVLHRILHERHVWDEDLLSWSVVERLDPHSDIFQFVLNSMAPHPFRHFCVLRYWRSDLNKGACALITMSVEHSDPMEVQGVWAVDLGSYFLMEHCGSGRSRLTYTTRLDTRGRSPEWYTRIFGHMSANFLARLKDSFRQVTPGPETRV